ncbi:unnamed protein product, partial [Linum tenue]
MTRGGLLFWRRGRGRKRKGKWIRRFFSCPTEEGKKFEEEKDKSKKEKDLPRSLVPLLLLRAKGSFFFYYRNYYLFPKFATVVG